MSSGITKYDLESRQCACGCGISWRTLPTSVQNYTKECAPAKVRESWVIHFCRFTRDWMTPLYMREQGRLPH